MLNRDFRCHSAAARPMSGDPTMCKSNGFALQRKPSGARITLSAASSGNFGFKYSLGKMGGQN
jgi:hypothetical protein